MKKQIFIFLFLFMFILNSYFVSSLEIKSNLHEFCFEPNLKKEIVYSLSSDKEETVAIRISNREFFEDFILNTDEIVTLQPSKEYKFSASVILPSEMENELEEIIVSATPYIESETEAVFGIIISKGARTRIFKCWNEKHAFLSNIRVAIQEDKIEFLTSAVNKGNENIDELTVIMDVYDSEKNKIMSFNPSTSLEEDDVQTFTGTYTEKLNPGKYTVETTLIYDGIESDQKLIEEFEIVDPTKVIKSTKKQNVVAAPTMVAKQAQTTADGAAPAEGFNWLLYIVLPAAILIVAGTLLFLRLRKK
ncbi:hypothetical protein KY335_01925 [Candidatus Woesearchaeota archaeon]|nr:hypothetical protein [Candidatus Woesearchaeota archaeon]